jgi:hypothetical protein
MNTSGDRRLQISTATATPPSMSSTQNNNGSVISDGDHVMEEPIPTYEETLQNAQRYSVCPKQKQQMHQLGNAMLRLQHTGLTFDLTNDLALRNKLEASIYP